LGQNTQAGLIEVGKMSVLEFTAPNIFSDPSFFSEDNQGMAKSAVSMIALFKKDPAFSLPGPVLDFVVNALERVASGQVITGIPLQTELTVHQASEILCVSESYMNKLLDSGEIASHQTNESRLIVLKDVLEYKERKKNLRLGVLAELVEESQTSGVY
jgi:excisionase family DNA binding protein